MYNSVAAEGANNAINASGGTVEIKGTTVTIPAVKDAEGNDVTDAYEGVAKISWKDEFHRSDIGVK